MEWDERLIKSSLFCSLGRFFSRNTAFTISLITPTPLIPPDIFIWEILAMQWRERERERERERKENMGREEWIQTQKHCTLQQPCNNFSQAFPIIIIFSSLPQPEELFITTAGTELLYYSYTSLGWVLLMKQPCDQTGIMLEEACIIRPAFNYYDIWPPAALLSPSLLMWPQHKLQVVYRSHTHSINDHSYISPTNAILTDYRECGTIVGGGLIYITD